MRFFQRSAWLCASACALSLCPDLGLAAEPAVPGLVQTQPASGRFVATERGFMVPYEEKIPGVNVTFRMEPVPGGTYRVGSPADEQGRRDDEAQALVTVQPYWIAAREVSWGEYKPYMSMHDIFKKLAAKDVLVVNEDSQADAITAPSSLYDPTFTFQFGEEAQLPAITISQYAAKQYTKWLSGLSGRYYRLPTEVEWEYACRAGSTTAYSFGDDPSKLPEYAWYYDNSSERTNKVGQKKPNAWGLYDMHGNVAEWVLDAYDKQGYPQLAGAKEKPDQDAAAQVNWPKELYPRVVRGGSWDEDADRLRSAARTPSHDDDWRIQDPNFPQSPWWYTSGHGLAVGFRVVRPLNPPQTAEGRERFWQADIDGIRDDVHQRIENEGRGARGLATPRLLEEIKKLNDE